MTNQERFNWFCYGSVAAQALVVVLAIILWILGL